MSSRAAVAVTACFSTDARRPARRYHRSRCPPSPRPARHRPRRRALQRLPRPARGRDRSLACFLGPLRRRADPFEPGQYMTIGVFVDGRIAAAALFGRIGAGGRRRRPATSSTSASSRAAPSRRSCGDAGRASDADDRAEGQVHAPARRRADHIFISSGTGNAPFVAMMRQLLSWMGRRDDVALPQRRVARPRAGLSRACLEDMGVDWGRTPSATCRR